MSINSIVSISQQLQTSQLSATLEVAAARRNLDQQEINGQAALKLMAEAAIPVDPNLGQSINISV